MGRLNSLSTLNIVLLTRALNAALAFHPPMDLEAIAKAAAEGYETALRLGKPEKVEAIVRSLLA